MQQKLPSTTLMVNNTANKSMVLRTKTPLVLCDALSQLPVAEIQTVLLHVGVGCDASGVPRHSREQTLPGSAHKAQADGPNQAVRPTVAPARPGCAFHPAARLCF